MKKIFREEVKKKLFQLRTAGEEVTEEKLAKLLCVSRTPIREALKELGREGFLERRKNKGIFLKKPSLKEISEIYDLRALLEGFACKLAAGKATKSDFNELQKLVCRYNEVRKKNNGGAAKNLDVAFHRKLVQISDNLLLLKILDNCHVLQEAFRISHTLGHEPPIEDSPYTHESIIKTLEKGDPDMCEKIAWSHVQWAKKRGIEIALNTRV